MQEIKTVIRSPYEPNDVHALWIDTSNIDSPVAKVHENGKWQGIGGDGGGSSSEETEIPEDGFAPNTFYNLGTITENTTFSMAEGEEGKVNHYFWVFETGDDVPEITWPEGIRLWEDNKAPVIAANQHYEISVHDGVGLYEVIGIDSTSRYLGIPLTIEAITDGIIPLYKIGEYPDPFIFKYKKNNEDWNVWDETNNNYNKVDVIAGDKVSFVANYNRVPYYDDPLRGFFANRDKEQSCSYKVYGNVASLVGGDDFVSLTELPQGECFYGLFGCEFSDRVSGLVDASNLILPNITLTDSCYFLMFANCINLERGPQILAKKLESCSCQSMFMGCSKLNYIKCLSTDISTNYCTSWWIDGVAESGTFVKAKGMDDWTVGHDGIPEGWMVVEEGGDEPELEPMEVRKNLGLYYTADFISYGEGEVVQLNSVTNALRFDIAAVLNGKQSLIEDSDEIIAALPTYEEIVASGGLYDSLGRITLFEKKTDRTTYLGGVEDYYICQGSDSVPSGFSTGDYHFNAPGVYTVLYDQEGDHPNPQLTWTKDTKIPSEYLPETDLSNVKIPGYVYITVNGNMNSTNVSVAEVASILHTTVAELNALFTTNTNYPGVAMLVVRPDYYYSRYELYKSRIGYSEASPIIITSGSDRILELGQPETPYYQHLKLTKHSNNQYDVLINAPD